MRFLTVAVFAFVFALSSCGDGAPLLFPPASEVHSVIPAQTEGVVGDPLAPAPGIVIRDARGNPVPGVLVEFRVTEGGGSIAATAAISDERGEARPGAWTLGERPGMNVLVAQPAGLAEVQLTAMAAPGSPALIEPVSDTEQEADLGTQVDHPPAVRVRDRFDNPVPGVQVRGIGDSKALSGTEAR